MVEKMDAEGETFRIVGKVSNREYARLTLLVGDDETAAYCMDALRYVCLSERGREDPTVKVQAYNPYWIEPDHRDMWLD